MFQATRRVEFRDTDAAGIVHFSAFFLMMESVEHEFLRSLGISVMPHASGFSASAPQDTPVSRDAPLISSPVISSEPLCSETSVTWPRVSANCDYQSAARFEDLLEIELSIGEIGDSSVRYDFAFRRGGTAIATGSLVAVCCHLRSGKLSKVSIPAPLRQKLECG